MNNSQCNVTDPVNGVMEIALQHPDNNFQISVDVARELAKEILRKTGGEQ